MSQLSYCLEIFHRVLCDWTTKTFKSGKTRFRGICVEDESRGGGGVVWWGCGWCGVVWVWGVWGRGVCGGGWGILYYNSPLVPTAMMTSSNGNIFRVTGLLLGNSPATGEFPAQRPVTRSFDVFFDLRLNKRLSKQSWDWWFETPSCSLWRHCNDYIPNLSLRACAPYKNGTLTVY